MIKVKALTEGRWRVAPGTSLDVVKGGEYLIPEDLASYLFKGGVVEYCAEKVVATPKVETKPFNQYEKQSIPEFTSKDEAVEFAVANGVTVDKRWSLNKIMDAIKGKA